MSLPILNEKSLHYVESAAKFLDESSFAKDDKTLRSSSLELFNKLGLPTKKNENYKYTNLNKFFPEKFKLAQANQVSTKDILKTPCEYSLVFDNGEFKEELSKLPSGISIKEVATKSHAFTITDPMEALNTSLVQKKYALKVEKNTKAPIVALIHRFESEENEIVMTSLEVTAETGSSSEFFEVCHSEREISNASLTHSSFDIQANAHLKHTKALLTKANHTHVGKVKAKLCRDSNFTSLTFSVDGKLNRNNVEVFIEEQGAHASVNGLYTGRGSQHQDCFTTIHHNAPHTTSNEVFKGILDDEARGVFTGKVIIHRDAQQVDSNQLNKNLLLSKKAHVDTRPQIEVYADDVKCGHGATVGQINQEEVFYLESRGIPKEKAQKILCHAFAYEAIETCENAELSQWLGEHLFELFEKYALEHLSLN